MTPAPSAGNAAVSASAWTLGDLADPTKCHAPLQLGDVGTATLLDWLRSMVRVRIVEEVIGDMVKSREVVCPCHLAIGQEACAVGVASVLSAKDRAFGAHRSHGHYLAMGASVEALLAEVLGRSAGCSGGMGGSMHLTAADHGLLGTVPIVGATIPMAVGAGIAAQLDGSGAVGVAYFGDGATEEGVFHESMNLAAVRRAPVLFVCEHNLFSSHLHVSLRQPTDGLSRYADAHCVWNEQCDGNDVVAVASAASRAAAHARAGHGPAFLELVTYRWRGHVGPNEDLDVGVKRADDLDMWKRRDPIRRLADALVELRGVSRQKLIDVQGSIGEEVAAALASARSAPFPERGTAERVLFASVRR